MRPVLFETRPMESLGRTEHLGSGIYSRDAHARESMFHRERDTDTQSSMRIPTEFHSRGTDRRGDMSERTRMWVEMRRMRPSQVAKCMPKKYGRSGDPYAHASLFKQVLRAEQITDFHTQYERPLISLSCARGEVQNAKIAAICHGLGITCHFRCQKDAAWVASSLSACSAGNQTRAVRSGVEVMKLSRNCSSIHQESNQERVSDGSIRSSASFFRLILHSLLCIAALVLGFRLSGETRLVAVFIKPAHGTFLSSSIARFYQARSFGAWPGSPYVIDDRRDFTPVVSESPPSAKSSRVHVGRHEILIRPWPHPNPVQTLTAHGLIEQIQHEQQRLYGLQERKQVIVVTSTYVRAFQAVYLSSLIHTLRIVPGPLVWIVVEAGGVSNETAEMLSQSRLSYYHLATQETMPADLRRKEQLEIHLKLEGLRFIRNHRLDGVVIFLDESIIFDVDLFDAAQKIAWFGTFLVGLLQHSELPAFTQENVELARNFSIASVVGKFKNTVGSSGTSKELNTFRDNRHSISVKEDPISRLSLPLDGPVCSPEGHMAGWYVSSPKKSRKWAAFALNSRMFWEDVSKPSWIKSWGELFCENSSLPESPLAFLRNYSYIEPLGDCGRSIMMWSMGVDSVEASVGSNFPSRWIISPPLEVVVPSRQTPWSAKPVEKSDFDSYTPPPYVHLTSETIMERGKGRFKGAKPRKGKHRSRHAKQDHARSIIEHML
ncbi:hypothetical protein L7F22_016961 [Adiantum nelumboides]|nr:hypothetical protein [Adiantum nelumboides]